MTRMEEDEEVEEEYGIQHPEPSPSPISRMESPAKSVKSIHWMLGSTKHPLFDYKVVTKNICTCTEPPFHSGRAKIHGLTSGTIKKAISQTMVKFLYILNFHCC